MGWDHSPGSYIGGSDMNATIICQPTVQDGGEVLCEIDSSAIDEPTICVDDDVPEYGTVVEAYVAELVERNFNVVFKYMDGSGQPAENLVVVP